MRIFLMSISHFTRTFKSYEVEKKQLEYHHEYFTSQKKKKQEMQIIIIIYKFQ